MAPGPLDSGAQALFAPALHLAAIEFAPFADSSGAGIIGYDLSIGESAGGSDIMPVTPIPPAAIAAGGDKESLQVSLDAICLHVAP